MKKDRDALTNFSMYVAGEVSGSRIYHEQQTKLMLTWITHQAYTSWAQKKLSSKV